MARKRMKTVRRRRLMSVRRLLTFGVFGLTLAIGAASVVLHPKQYFATSTIVFNGSPSVAEAAIVRGTIIDPTTQSALARFANTTVVGDIFARLYQSATKANQLATLGLVGKLYVATKSTITSDTPGHGPVIVFTVSSPTPDDAVRGVSIVTADLERELAARQEGYDPELIVSMALVSSSDQAILASGSRIRSAVAFFVLSLMLAWLVGRMYNWITQTRSRRPVRAET